MSALLSLRLLPLGAGGAFLGLGFSSTRPRLAELSLLPMLLSLSAPLLEPGVTAALAGENEGSYHKNGDGGYHDDRDGAHSSSPLLTPKPNFPA